MDQESTTALTSDFKFCRSVFPFSCRVSDNLGLRRCTELSTFVHPCNENDDGWDLDKRTRGHKSYASPQLFSAAEPKIFGHVRCS
jgi:hypothetical protein